MLLWQWSPYVPPAPPPVPSNNGGNTSIWGFVILFVVGCLVVFGLLRLLTGGLRKAGIVSSENSATEIAMLTCVPATVVLLWIFWDRLRIRTVSELTGEGCVLAMSAVFLIFVLVFFIRSFRPDPYDRSSVGCGPLYGGIVAFLIAIANHLSTWIGVGIGVLVMIAIAFVIVSARGGRQI